MRKRSIGIVLLAISGGANSLLMGCREAPPGLPEESVADSAGVQIILSDRPASQTPWPVDPDPILAFGAEMTMATAVLTNPVSIFVNHRGEYVVGDGGIGGGDQIFVFDSLGTPGRSCGGKGDGPGEFSQLWWVGPYRGDSIAAFDMGRERVSIFDAECDFARQVQFSRGNLRRTPGVAGFAGEVNGVFPDGSFLAYPGGWLSIEEDDAPAWYLKDQLRYGSDGEVIDTLGTFEIMQYYWDGEVGRPLPFAGVAQLLPYLGGFIQGTGLDSQVKIFDADNRLSRMIRWNAERRLVTHTDEQRYREGYLDRMASSPEVNDAVMERVRQSLDETVFPSRMPVFSQVVISDGNEIWVQAYQPRWVRSGPNSEPAHWYVFSEKGEWLANVELPRRFLLNNVVRDELLGFHVDDFDVRTPRIYRFSRN